MNVAGEDPIWTDTHLHLGRREFSGEVEDIVARAEAAGVGRFLNVGYDLPSSEFAAETAAADRRMLAAVGVHPHDATALADADGAITADGDAVLDRLAALAVGVRVVAVGEIGLDFYRDLSPRPAQRAAFRAQLALAGRLDRPVVLHVRDAYDEAIAELEREGVPPRGGVMHSFAGELEHAEWAVAHGLLLGIGGPVTYRNGRLPGILGRLSPDVLILETDAPWLPPVPYRGKRNEPAYLVKTAAAVADIYGMTPEDLARVVDRNFERVFRPEAAA